MRRDRFLSFCILLDEKAEVQKISVERTLAFEGYQIELDSGLLNPVFYCIMCAVLVVW